MKENNLRACAAPSRRPAFSLAELVVAIGILILMLSLAGQVFTITVQSTGKATALTEVSQQLRILEESLRADLRNVDPERTLLVIQGNPVNAYWTGENKEAGIAAASGAPNPAAGYPHASDPDREDPSGKLVKPRADVLFFYTARRGASYLDPRVTSNLQQVMYGHAELGEFILEPTSSAANPDYRFDVTRGDPDPNEVFYFPVNASFGPNLKYPDPNEASSIPAQAWHLARRSTLLLPTPARLETGGVNLQFNPSGFLSLVPADAAEIFGGERDHVGNFPYEDVALRPAGPEPYFLPPILMDPTNSPFARSWVDQTPPALLVNDADRDGNHDNQFFGLGHYMLPNCASFKVEWALDPRSLFVDGRLDGVTETLWFDPGDEGDGTAGNPPDPLRALHARIDALQVQITATPAAQRQPLEDAQKQLCSLLYDRICLTTNCDLTCSDPEVLLGTVFSLAERVEGVRFNQQNANCRSLGFSAIHANCGWPAAALALDRRMNLAIFTSGRPGLRDDLNGDGGIDDKDYDYVNTIPDPMFPAALRITVDVYDNRGRLDRPIRHVMVIPIGS